MGEHVTNILPAFASEAEEADWWFENREAIGDDFVQAMRDGRATQGAMVRRGLVRTPTLLIDHEDLLQAKALAAKKGIDHEDYLRSLLHEALEREAKLAS